MSESAPEVAPETVEQQRVESSGEQEQQPQQETEAAAPDTGEKADVDWRAEAEKWKSLSRKWEKDAKANVEAARRWAEFEESQKTEAQKLADRLKEAEERAAQAELGRARLMAAATYDIPPSLLERIVGTNEEEIAESAQALAKEIEEAVAKRLAEATPPAQPAQTRPVEALRPGAAPGPDAADGSDPNSWIRAQLGRR